jgi:hypothetical protein
MSEQYLENKIDDNTDLLNKLVLISSANNNLSSIHDQLQKHIDKQDELIYKYKLATFILVIIVIVLIYIIYKKNNCVKL